MLRIQGQKNPTFQRVMADSRTPVERGIHAASPSEFSSLWKFHRRRILLR